MRAMRGIGLGALLAIITAAGPAAAQSYNVLDLGVFGGYVHSEAQGINSVGQVAGNLYDAESTTSQAFLFNGYAMSILGTSAGKLATGINDSETVVGYMGTDTGQLLAFAYQDGQGVSLGTLGGATSYALGINNNGAICGGSVNLNGYNHAFVYENGVMTDIHYLAQMTAFNSTGDRGNIVWSYNSEATDINDDRQVVGYFLAPNDLGTDTERPFLYENEAMTELGNLGGNNSRALAISDTGQIVGWSEAPTGKQLAVMFYTNGNVRNLGTPGVYDTWSAAYGVNNLGQIVGASDSGAFLYQNGAIVDLNSRIPANSGWTLQCATDINDSGWITGYGLRGEAMHAFILKPPSADDSDDDSDDTDDSGSTPLIACGSGTGVPMLFSCLTLLAWSAYPTRRKR